MIWIWFVIWIILAFIAGFVSCIAMIYFVIVWYLSGVLKQDDYEKDLYLTPVKKGRRKREW